MKRSRLAIGAVLLAAIVGLVASAVALRAAGRIDHEAECTSGAQLGGRTDQIWRTSRSIST